MTLLNVVVALLMLAGLAGAVLPMLPGTPLIFGAALLYAYATDFETIGFGRLAILAVLAVVSSALEYVAGAAGARKFGGSRAAVIGAIIGAVGGLAWPPFGLLVGPLVGAIAGEFMRTREFARSVRTGMGTAVGVIGGVLSHVALALVMVLLFLWWVTRG
jgi:uncharacterized protein YqgC (DUF456 family)